MTIETQAIRQIGTPHAVYGPNFGRALSQQLHKAEHLLGSVKAALAEHRRELDGVDDEYKDGLLSHLMNDRVHEIETTLVLCRILFCMATEQFVNQYGVLTLGQKFFQTNLERLRIESKIASTFAITTGKLISPKDRVVKTLREMFESRNSLIHPKTKHFAPEDLANFAATQLGGRSHQWPNKKDDLDPILNLRQDLTDWFVELQGAAGDEIEDRSFRGNLEWSFGLGGD